MNKQRLIITACYLGMLGWLTGASLAAEQPAAPAKETKQVKAAVVKDTKQEKPASAVESKGAEAAKGADEEVIMRRAAARRAPGNYQTYQYQPEAATLVGVESLLSEITKEIAGKVYYELKELGESGLTGKVAVTVAVPLSDFQRESEFGRVVAEYLLTDIADRGLNVTELRIGKEIEILPQTGEFILTRNTGELANSTAALDYVVVSTFSNTRKNLLLQGRLVSLKDLQIIASWRHSLPLNRELLSLFQVPEKPFTIPVKGVQR